MGCEIKAEDYKYLQAVKDLGYHVSSRFLTPWQRIDFLFNLTQTKREQEKCARIMHKFTQKIIDERRRKLMNEKTENLENLDDDDIGLKKKMCLLDVLLQSTVDGKVRTMQIGWMNVYINKTIWQSLSNADIQEEVDNFTFAGHDTTTNAICFTLFTISKFPEVQRKLNEEIEQIIGDGYVTFKVINEMKYLDLVIKETLRLYPPGTFGQDHTFLEHITLVMGEKLSEFQTNSLFYSMVTNVTCSKMCDLAQLNYRKHCNVHCIYSASRKLKLKSFII